MRRIIAIVGLVVFTGSASFAIEFTTFIHVKYNELSESDDLCIWVEYQNDRFEVNPKSLAKLLPYHDMQFVLLKGDFEHIRIFDESKKVFTVNSIESIDD